LLEQIASHLRAVGSVLELIDTTDPAKKIPLR